MNKVDTAKWKEDNFPKSRKITLKNSYPPTTIDVCDDRIWN